MSRRDISRNTSQNLEKASIIYKTRKKQYFKRMGIWKRYGPMKSIGDILKPDILKKEEYIELYRTYYES